MRPINFFIILIFLLLVECSTKQTLVSSTQSDKPAWIDRKTELNQYKGMATSMKNPKEASDGAVKDALRKVAEEIGTKVHVDFVMEKVEENEEIKGRVKSKVKIEAKAELSGVKIIETYTEKHKSEKGDYYFNGFALIELPPNEISRIRRKLEEYNNEILTNAENLFNSAEEKEQEYPYYALCEYKSIIDMLEDIDLPGAMSLISRTRIRINYLEETRDPMIELENLSGNTHIIDEIKMVKSEGIPIEDNILDVDEGFRINLALENSGYIYIIGYDRETKEARLLLPNKYEKDNLAKGKQIYPKTSEFFAEPPGGSNTIFVIIAKEETSISSFERQGYYYLNNKLLWEFIRDLKNSQFDLKKVDFYVRD